MTPTIGTGALASTENAETMSDADGEEDGSLALGTIFTVSPDKFLDVPRSVITIIQFPPPSPLTGGAPGTSPPTNARTDDRGVQQ